MLRFLVILLLVAPAYPAAATDDPAIKLLNPGLVPLYRQLIADPHSEGLIGKRLALQLRLKHASPRMLLFADTQIVVDGTTRYYLIKWQYQPGDIAELLGKAGNACRVEGKIVRVVSSADSPRMPYLVVELQSVSL